MYSIISPFSKTFDDIGLIYLVPEFLEKEIKLWQLVEIPLKNDIENAIVLEFLEELPEYIEKSKIKPIISIKYSNILLKEYQLKLVKRIANYYFCSIHQSLNLFFPRNLKSKLFKNKFDLEKKEDEKIYHFNFKKKLTKNQENVFNQIKNTKNKNIFLYWLTWSWKTEIFINLIKEQIDKKKQVLFLTPEIILSNQLANRIKQVFWEDVLVINSFITEANKTKIWKSIHINNAKIIIWTRSSLFYPYENLWLIIFDEEQDNSYNSDSSPKYKSDEIILKIWELTNTKIVFSSGSPSIKNMYKSLKWKFELIQLLNKYDWIWDI